MGIFKESIDLSTLMGLRLKGLIPAISLPILLTSVLFLGPITISFLDGSWKDVYSLVTYLNVLIMEMLTPNFEL